MGWNVENNKLYNVSTVKVPYTIPDDFNKGIMIVGESPGADEEELRQGFVGTSGILLNGWLKLTKIPREECIISNVFRYRPKKNKVDNFFISTKASKENDIEITASYPKIKSKNLIFQFQSEPDYLHHVIKKYKPKVVIAMGVTAAWAILGEKIDGKSITEVQGKIFEYEYSKYVKVMPTFHPASILYDDRINENTKEKAIIEAFKEAAKYFYLEK